MCRRTPSASCECKHSLTAPFSSRHYHGRVALFFLLLGICLASQTTTEQKNTANCKCHNMARILSWAWVPLLCGCLCNFASALHAKRVPYSGRRQICKQLQNKSISRLQHCRRHGSRLSSFEYPHCRASAQTVFFCSFISGGAHVVCLQPLTAWSWKG